jgi:hypothetical protein
MLLAGVQNPSAKVLGHGNYSLSATVVRNHEYVDSNWTSRFPYETQLNFGFFGNVEMGLSFAEGLSVQGKAKIFAGEDFIPSFTFGVRSLFDSPEAQRYNYKSSSPYEGESYLLAEKEFWEGGVWYLGSAILPGANEIQLFWGWKESLKGNLSIHYEGFQRQTKNHHNIGLAWQPVPEFAIQTGLIKAKKWFFQDGEVGFYSSLKDEEHNSLNAPGFYLQIVLQAKIHSSKDRFISSRLQNLERSQKDLTDSISLIKVQLDRAVKALSSVAGPSVEIRKKEEAVVADLFAKIISETQKAEYDPPTVIAWQDSLLSINDAAQSYLQRLAEHPSTSQFYKETVIRIMGYSKLRTFTPYILPLLRDESALIRREALISLSHIGDLAAREEIRKLFKDPDPIVAEIAVFVDKELTKKNQQILDTNTPKTSK